MAGSLSLVEQLRIWGFLWAHLCWCEIMYLSAEGSPYLISPGSGNSFLLRQIGNKTGWGCKVPTYRKALFWLFYSRSSLIVNAWTYDLGWEGCFVWRCVCEERRPFQHEIQVHKTCYFPSTCMLFFFRLQKLCPIVRDEWFFILNLSWFVGAMDLLIPTLMAA